MDQLSTNDSQLITFKPICRWVRPARKNRTMGTWPSVKTALKEQLLAHPPPGPSVFKSNLQASPGGEWK
jgi:hypothetical protein